MIRQFIKPAYSHAPWKNPKHPSVYKGKRSGTKVLGTKVLGAKVLGREATIAKKGGALATPTIAQEWNMFPLIAGFTTFFKILK